MVIDRLTSEWVSPEEMERRRADREEAMFKRQPSQGQLCAPMVISDCQGGIVGLQSMADGKHYDSKSQMRKHYREAGVREMGTDAPTERGKRHVDPHAKRDRQRAIGRAFDRVGLPPV